MVRPPRTSTDSEGNHSFSSNSNQSGEFTVRSNETSSPHRTIQNELSSNGNPYIGQYLNIYYKKILDPSMINEMIEIIENLLGLYENLDDESANSYLLSYLLLRVGCFPKSYDFEQFLDFNREERDKLIKDNWSGKKVLMKFSSEDEQIEKNYKRFEAFFSSFSSLRFDDILRLNNETNLKKIIFLLMEDLRSTIIEHRFTVLLALEAILRGLISTVVHSRKNKPGKISPFIGQKDALKIFEFISMVVTKSILPRLTDSENEISRLAHQTLIELAEIWPNSWIEKQCFQQCFYSILSEDEKSDFNQSIRFLRTLLNHKDLEKDSFRPFFHQFLVEICSIEFEIHSVSNTNSIYKLLNDLLTIYPQLFTLKMIFHWSTAIFQDNHRTQQMALNFYLRFIEMNEDHLQSNTIWPHLIQLYFTLFQRNISEESTACLIHAIETNSKISMILWNVSGIEHFLREQTFDQNSFCSLMRMNLQILRSIFILHLNRERIESTNENSSEDLSQLIFKLVHHLIQQDRIEKILFFECLTALETILCSLSIEKIEENSISFEDFLNDLKMFLTTHQFSQTFLQE